MRLYTKSSAAAAAPRTFPQVAIIATSIDGYTTEDSLQTSMPNCSEFAVVYQSAAMTPDVGEGVRSKHKTSRRFELIPCVLFTPRIPEAILDQFNT